MNTAIIVAAGQSQRMGGGVDKLFIELGGLPTVGHTWRRFDSVPSIADIILVVRAGREPEFESLAARFHPDKPYRLVAGGAARQDSVWNGITHVGEGTDLVAIQDGARPCTPVPLIEATLSAAREHGAAVAAAPMTDSIKESKDGLTVSRHLDRSRLWAVQTPQCFRLAVIRRALKSVRDHGLSITDDTAACESIGQSVRLVSSPHPNPKLTTPADVPYFNWLLAED